MLTKPLAPSVLNPEVEMPRPPLPFAAQTQSSPFTPVDTAGKGNNIEALAEQPSVVPANDFDRIVAKSVPLSEQLVRISIGADIGAVIEGSGLRDGTVDLRRMTDGFQLKATIKF